VPEWVEQGPIGPIEKDGNGALGIGAIESIAVQTIKASDGKEHYIVFAGTVNGGVWRAGTEYTDSDGVQHWSGDITPSMLTPHGAPNQIVWVPMSDYQPSLAISSLALDPTDPNPRDPSQITLWAGTGSLSSWGGAGGQAIGLLKTTDGGSHWTVLGSDLAGQHIVSVVPTTVSDPGQVVLVACLDGSGIMRSTNGGQSFQSVPATDSKGNAITLSGRATDVIADPLNGDRFFAAVVGFGGTGNSGVFESDDGGAHWTEMPGDSAIIQINGYDLRLMSWGDGSKVPVSGRGLVIAGTDSNGLLHIRTFDPDGVRTDTYEALEGGTLHLVSADASGHVLSDSPESSLSAARAQAITALKEQLPGWLPPHDLTQAEDTQVRGEATLITGQTQINGADNLKLAAQRNANGTGTTLFVATGGNGLLSGAFQGTVIVGGVSQWNRIGTLPNLTYEGAPYVPPEDSGIGHFAAAADPNQPGVFYVGTYQGNLFQVNANVSSSPAWKPWDYAHADFRHIAFLGLHALLAANDGGLYGYSGLSPASTPQWTSLNAGLAINEQYSATYDPTTGRIFAGSQDNNVNIQTSHASETWKVMTDTGDGFNTAVDFGGNRYYVGNHLVFRDGTQVSLTGLSTDPVVKDATTDKQNFANSTFAGQAIAASPTNFSVIGLPFVSARLMMVGYTGIYESQDAGDTVTDLTPTNWNADVNLGAGQYNVVKNIAYAGDGTNAAYVSTYIQGGTGGRLWVRSSLTSSFTEVPTASLPWNLNNPNNPNGNANNLNVESLAVDPKDYHYAYFLLSDGEVWETTNAGAAGSWTDLTDNLRDGNFTLGTIGIPGSNKLAIVDRNPTAGGQGALVVGALGGVYAHQLGSPGFSDAGWETVGNALPNVVVTGLQYVPSEDLLLASTFGRGAWTLPNASTSVLSTAGPKITVIDDDSVRNHIVIDASPTESTPNCVEITLNGRLEYSGPAANVGSITVDEGSASDAVDINDTWVSMPVTVNEGSGFNTVNITPSPKTRQFGYIVANVQINPGSGHNSLNIYDNNDWVGHTFTVTATSIYDDRFFGGTVNFSGQSLINIFGGSPNSKFGSQGSTFNVQGTSSGTTLDIRDAGGNFLNIGNQGNTQSISGSVYLEPSGDTSTGDTLTVDDSADPTTAPYTVALGLLVSLLNGIPYGTVDGLTANNSSVVYMSGSAKSLIVKTPAVNNTVDVYDTLATTYLISGGSLWPLLGVGWDTVNLGDKHSVQGIERDLYIENPPGLDSVTVDDSGDPNSTPAVTISDTEITGLAPGTIHYAGNGLQSLAIDGSDEGGNGFTITNTPTNGLDPTDPNSLTTTLNPSDFFGGCTVNVQATAGPLIIKRRLSQDTITIGNAANGLTSISADVSVQDIGTDFAPPNAADTLIVDDSADPVARTAATISASRIAGLAPKANINYQQGYLDSLTINGGAHGNNFTITNTPDNGRAPTDPDFLTTTLNDGRGTNTVTVLGTTGGLAINAQGGNDTITLGNLNTNLDGISSNRLSVDGGAGRTTLFVDDEANQNVDTAPFPALGDVAHFTEPVFTVTNSTVSRHNPVAEIANGTSTNYDLLVSYQHLAGITVIGGDLEGLTAGGTCCAGNTFDVTGTVPGTPVTLQTGSGLDTVNLGSSTSTLDPIQGPLNVNGRGSNTTLNVIDQQATANEIYTIWDNSINRSGMAPITYAYVSHLVLSGGTGSNVLYVENTAAGTTTDVYGGTGSGVDEFWPDLYSIRGPLHFHGQTSPRGESYAVLYDYFNSNPGTYTLTAGALNRSGMAPITYDHLVETILYTSNVAIATINIQSIAPNDVPIVGAGPGDTVTIGQNHSLAQILGRPIVSGQPVQVTVDDSADTQTGQQVTFNNNGRRWGISGLAADWMYFDLGSGSSLQVLGGSPLPGSSLGNTFTVASLPALSLSIQGGTGNDTFQVPTQPAADATLSLNGNGGIDTLVGPNANATWFITNTDAGTVAGITFSSVANLAGGTGNNTFQFGNGAGITGPLDGGGGTNTLDYTQYAGDILVDLLLGTATAVAGGIAHIQQVIGSQGNDLMVGNANPSKLIGGTGRNILIGGAGMATLDASRGNGDNILIGGTTDWDLNLAALGAIMAEWDRTDLGFNDRRSDLLNGTNGQGKAPLNIVNGQLILLKPATDRTSSNGTVHASAFADTLIGSTAIDPATGKRVHNWFLYALDDVIENDLSSSDRKNKIT
jgi:hypothetical protein